MSTLSTRLRQIAALTPILIAVLFLIGCVPQENIQSNQAMNNAPVNSEPVIANTQPAPVISEQAAVNSPFTLPLLDAMLVDETFVSEAKSALQLTDQEIQKLRDVARGAVHNLTNDPAADDSRSTRSALADARKQVQQILGNEKSARLIALVQKRWSGGEELPAANANSVPSDTRIVVNAAAYRMDIFDKGKLVKSYKIGIGYPEFPLPTGLRKAKEIIFNPTWTPPDEPWVKGEVAPGKKVEAGSDLNPLGPIKIPIGLPSLIHGGKSPARLGTFASHGCVGLTTPQIQDFALQISTLSGKPLTLLDIKNYGKDKTVTKEVKLDEAIPVELRYETIVVENGVLKIYRDVYEKGTNTEENLKRILETFGVSLEQLKPDVRAKILAGLNQMANDAAGNAVTDSNGANSKQNSGASNTLAKTSNATANSKSIPDRITRSIKGRKEVVFKLPKLAGKGYPAPVGVRM